MKSIIILSVARKHEAILRRISQIDDFNEKEEMPFSGTVIISDVRFPPKQDSELNTEWIQWFVCLFMSDNNVVASEVVQPGEDGSVVFNGPFKFDGLNENFQIHVAIYSMKLRTDKHFSNKVWFEHHPLRKETNLTIVTE